MSGFLRLLLSFFIPGAGLIVDGRTRNEGLAYLILATLGLFVLPFMSFVIWAVGLVRTAMVLDKEKRGGE